jgi:hypothetical protein
VELPVVVPPEALEGGEVVAKYRELAFSVRKTRQQVLRRERERERGGGGGEEE